MTSTKPISASSHNYFTNQKIMKLTQKVTQNIIFGLCLLTIPIMYARTRQVAVKPTETILEPATVQTQATPTPVAEFKGTSNDYTPAERKAMIEAQTRARKQEEADAKAIANGTYKGLDALPVANSKDCKPGVRTEANVINCGYFYPDEIAKLSYKEREKYRVDEREKYLSEARAENEAHDKRRRAEDPEYAAFQDEFERKSDIMIAEYDRYIEAKMDAGFSREDAVRLWKHDQNK
jgi:hypothetical protein